MRILISIFIFTISLNSYSQRISFEDPDLTFSFKKPKNWEVFDDGYVVKVSPSAMDSAHTYFTITYFEDAESFGLIPASDLTSASTDENYSTIKIDGEEAKYVKKLKNESHSGAYTFMKYGQRFVIETATPRSKQNPIFRKIIRSIQIIK